jgi:hypothetical protein
MLELVQRVEEALARVVRSAAFRNWVKNETIGRDDIILINNSFLGRKQVKTNKNELYLAVTLDGHSLDFKHGWVAKGPKLTNGVFKRLTRKAKDLELSSLMEATQAEVERLGELLFVLIGVPDDQARNEEPIANRDFHRLVWAQGATRAVELFPEEGTIQIANVDDEPAIWGEVERLASEASIQLSESFREALSTAVTAVQSSAVAAVTLPGAHPISGRTLTDRVVDALERQIGAYEAALNQLKANPREIGPRMEIYRLAYTFASETMQYLSLLTSVGDLKPLVLWLTIDAHVQLDRAFAGLPWREAGQKATPEGYRDAIADARNSAFHNALPFRSSLRVELPQGAIRDAKITLFGQYARKTNAFEYEDKALVEVLLQFTRARERQLPLSFWDANLEVMHAVKALFDGTSRTLRVLHQVVNAAPLQGSAKSTAA